LWNRLVFQKEMMIKEDPIKLEKKRTWKNIDQENSVAVDRPVDHTQQRRNVDRIFDRQQALSKGTCRQPLEPVDSQRPRIGFRFPFWARSVFLSGGLWIKLKFYSLKDLFLKIEGSRIVLDQGNQLLQGLIKFFKHPTAKVISLFK